MRKILLWFLLILWINIWYANYEVEVSNINDYDYSEFVNFAPNNWWYVKTIANEWDNWKKNYWVKEDFYYPDKINSPSYTKEFSYLQWINWTKFTILDHKWNKINNISKKWYVYFSEDWQSYALYLSNDNNKWFLYYNWTTTPIYDYIDFEYYKNTLIYTAGDKKWLYNILWINWKEYNCYNWCKDLSFSKDWKHFSFYIEKDWKKHFYKDWEEYWIYDEIWIISYFNNWTMLFTTKINWKWVLNKEWIISKKYNNNFNDLFFSNDFNNYANYDKNLFFSTKDESKKDILITIWENWKEFIEYNKPYYNIECNENLINWYIYCFWIKDIWPDNKKVYFRYDINKNIFEEYFTFNNKFTNTNYFQTTDNKNLLVNYENNKFYIYEDKIKINYGYDFINEMKNFWDNYCLNTFNHLSKPNELPEYTKNSIKYWRYSIIYNWKSIFKNDWVFKCWFSKWGGFYYSTLKDNKYFLVFNDNYYPLYDNPFVMNFYSDNNGNFDFYTYKNQNLIINNNWQEYELKNYELLFQTDHVFFLKNKTNYKKVMFVNGNFSNEYDDLDYSDIFHKYIIATTNWKKLIIDDNLAEIQKYNTLYSVWKLEDSSIIFIWEIDWKKTIIINWKELDEYPNITNIQNQYHNSTSKDIKIITYEKNWKYYSTPLDEEYLIEKYWLKNIKETQKTIPANPQLDKVLNPFFEKIDKKWDEMAQKTYKTIISKLDVLLQKKLSLKNKNILNYLKEKLEEKIK